MCQPGMKERARENKDEGRVVSPLTVTHLSESLKFSTKTVRKILTSLNISPENAPQRFRAGKYNVRGIFFNPTRLEKRLSEFVVDYKQAELGDILKLISDAPHAVRGTPGTLGTNSTPDHSTLFPFTPSCDPKTEDIKDAENTNVLKDVKDWCYNHRNDRSEISLNELSMFAKDSLRVEPSIVVQHAFEQGILAPSPTQGMAVVVV